MIDKILQHIRDRVNLTGITPDYIYISENEYNQIKNEIDKTTRYMNKFSNLGDSVSIYCEYGRIQLKILPKEV